MKEIMKKNNYRKNFTLKIFRKLKMLVPKCEISTKTLMVLEMIPAGMIYRIFCLLHLAPDYSIHHFLHFGIEILLRKH